MEEKIISILKNRPYTGTTEIMFTLLNKTTHAMGEEEISFFWEKLTPCLDRMEKKGKIRPCSNFKCFYMINQAKGE